MEDCNKFQSAYVEFLASLNVYIRIQEDQTVCDERDSAARKLAELPVKEVVSLMEPHDLAAIVSGVTALVSPSAVARLRLLQGNRLRSALQSMAQAGSLPLVVAPNHPVDWMLLSMINEPQGASVYRDVAVLLDMARTEPRLRSYLYHAAGARICRPPVPVDDSFDEDKSDDTAEDEETDEAEVPLCFATGND